MPSRRFVVSVAMTVATMLGAGGCSALVGKASAPAAAPTTTAPSTLETTSTTGSSTGSSASGFVPQTIDWSRCGGRLQCATLNVPRDYSDPAGATIELS